MTLKIDGVIGLILMVFFALLSYVDHSIATFFVFAYSIFLILILGIGVTGISIAIYVIMTNPTDVTYNWDNPVKRGLMFYLGIVAQTLFWYSVFVNTSIALSVVGVTLLILVVLGSLLVLKLAKDLIKEQEERKELLEKYLK